MDIKSLFKRKTKTSHIAKQRLKLVITQDRFDINEESMKKLQFELTEVLARYFEFTMNSVRMSLKQEGNSYVLVADFPYNKKFNKFTA